MIYAALATPRDYLKTHPDRTRRFLQAYLEGIKIALADAESAKQMIGKYTKTTDPGDLESSYQAFYPAWERLPIIPAAAVQTLLNFASHQNAKTAKPESFSTTRDSANSASQDSSRSCINKSRLVAATIRQSNRIHVASPNKFTNLVPEFRHGEWLVDVTIAALIYAALNIRVMEQRRCCQDRDMLGLGIGAKTSHRLPTIHYRHHHIQQN